MNLFQQCKAMLTPHGQVQMSYDRFKNTFGELGVAKWRAFLMDNAYLPDGTYNGITKMTITSVNSPRATDSRCYLGFYPKVIGVESDTAWPYGFSNYEITSEDEHYETKPNKTAISITSGHNIYIRIKDLAYTKEAYDAYLAKHPVVLYFYDSSVYSGSIVSADMINVAYCFYTSDATDTSMPAGTNKDIHDVQGKYHWYGNVGGTVSYKDYDADLMIGAGYNIYDSTNHRVNFKNNAYSLDAAGLAQFKANELPRAIVWKK